MPVLKISQGGDSSKMVSYLLHQNEAGNRVQALGGNVVGREAENIEREFRATREQFGQHGGREYYHVALSFERQDLGDLAGPDGKPLPESLRDYGEEWAKGAGIAQRHDYLVVVHGEKGHPHAHVIWNATDRDGRKYWSDSRNIDRLRDVNDRLARAHGIQRELDRVRDPHRPSDKFLRQAERGGGTYSWKLDMQDRVREAARRSFSEEEFANRLKKRGVDLRVRGEKFSYGMKDKTGKQRACREGRLGEGYRRATLLEKFSLQREQLKRDPDAYRRRLKEEQSGRYSWQRDLRGRIAGALKASKDHEGFKATLERQGVKATQAVTGRYRFEFQDRHGLMHSQVEAEHLYKGTSDRIAVRLHENAEWATVPCLAQAPGREASGLVASLMRKVESASREPHGGRAAEGPPTREDLRYDRPRRHEGHEDTAERW